ncbi:MAG: pyruvate kinase [Gammaproteobacteria bacterium]|nr:pyruvate kinase [Gammaproteobacteria bacterium]
MRRRTKIICTVGPSSNEWETIRSMHEAGMDVVRINMSHSSHDEAAKTVALIRKLNRTLRHTIPILLDTKGPEIRTGERIEPVNLVPGAEVLLSGKPRGEERPEQMTINVGYPEFAKSVQIGDTIRLDNGLINLEVMKQADDGLVCRVTDGGELGSRRHVNLPGVHVNLPAISLQDREDIEFAKENEISFIAQSFVRSADDVLALQELLGSSHQWVKIIAKIENHEGVQEAESISKVAYGLMVARGDLGIEMDIARLPRLQRQLVDTALRMGRRCVMATHLLESMVENPIPTRAEAIDVANAVYEGVDAVLLSSETSIGRRPVEVVEQLRRILEESERAPGLNFSQSLPTSDTKQNLARSAVELAERCAASGIIVVTRSGLMADLVTNCAPKDVPIFAFSNLGHTLCRLMLNRGVYAHRTSFNPNPELTIQSALEVLGEREGLVESDLLVVVSDVLSEGAVDSIQLRRAQPS